LTPSFFSYTFFKYFFNESNSVHLQHDATTDTVQHSHEIVVSSTSSDCNTCFDSTLVNTLPIATYSSSQDLLKRRMRCAYNAMAIGPNPLRSIPGAISTELILPATISKNQSVRIRAIFQHAPVWEQGIEPGSCPPQGLKLFRMILCRESLLDTKETLETSMSKGGGGVHPYFMQNIPPYQWHKKWAGTSWTCTCVD